MGILDKLMGRSGDEDYVNIDLGQFEEVSGGGPSEILVKMAELNDLEVLPEIKTEIERGNLVLVDISPMRREKDLLDECDRGVEGLRRGSEGRNSRPRRQHGDSRPPADEHKIGRTSWCRRIERSDHLELPNT